MTFFSLRWSQVISSVVLINMRSHGSISYSLDLLLKSKLTTTTYKHPRQRSLFVRDMNKERNRRFSAEQTRLPTATTGTFNIVAERGLSPNHLLFVDRFNLQTRTRSTEDRVSDREQPSKGLTVHLNNEAVASLDYEVYLPGFWQVSEENKKAPENITKQPQAFFVKRSDQSPRSDIGTSVKRHRSPQENSLMAKQGQFNSNPSSISGRRMSSPGKLLNIPLNKQNSASTRIVTPFERKTNRLITQVNHSLHAKNESRDGLPKITTSLETLTTEEHFQRSRSSEDVRKDGKKASKWSPQSFRSDMSTDQSQGLLESKIIPESRLTPPQTLVLTEEASEILSKKLGKTKIIVQSSQLDGGKAAKNTAVARPFDTQTDSEDLSGITKVGENKRINDRKISLEYSRASSVSERMKHQSQKVPMSAQMKVDHRPRRKTPFRMDRTTASGQQDPGTTNLEDDLDLKVKDFLRKHQPKASPRTLKVKAVKKKPAFPASKLRERRSQERITVNTNTCPSSNLVNQDRSWYYQDRRGKCRYLRVPESPTPPIEWVFQRTSSP